MPSVRTEQESVLSVVEDRSTSCKSDIQPRFVSNSFQLHEGEGRVLTPFVLNTMTESSVFYRFHTFWM